MGDNRYTKSVAFNKKNEDDQKIEKFTKRRNFSKFAKMCMLEYIKSQEMLKTFKGESEQPDEQSEKIEEGKINISKNTEEKNKQPSTAQKLAQMKEQLKRPAPPSTSPKLFRDNKLSK